MAVSMVYPAWALPRHLPEVTPAPALQGKRAPAVSGRVNNAIPIFHGARVMRQHSSGLRPPFLLLTEPLTNSHISGQGFSSVAASEKALLAKMPGFQGVRGSPCCQSQIWDCQPTFTL